MPNLCADRIDYSLRTAVSFKEIKTAWHFLDSLQTINGQWVFKSLPKAKEYAYLFQKLNNRYYAGLESAVMFRTVGDYLRYALLKNYISKSDLYTTDRTVLQKIRQHAKIDPKLKLLFARMNNKVKIKNNPKNYDQKVFCKSRIVDPLCQYRGETKKLSEIYKTWKKQLIWN